MAEGNAKTTSRELYDFAFVLSSNGHIVCQRYFQMDDFRAKSLKSLELIYCIDECVEIIRKNLKEKTNIYNWYTAPQVYENKEEMEEMIAKGHLTPNTNCPYHNIYRPVPCYIVLRDSEDIYVFDGHKAVLNPKNINRYDYVKVKDDEPMPSVLKFAFLVKGKEVASKIFDGTVYPRFVRSNIDLSNSKNRYREEGVFAPFESTLVDIYNSCMEDLIPKIISTICSCCSNYNNEGDEPEYTTIVNYGNKTYNLDIKSTYYRNLRQLEQKLKKKTDIYFESFKARKKED